MSGRIRTFWASRPLLADGALAAAIAALSALSAATADTPWTWLLVAGLTAPLVLRRRAPLPAFAVMALVAFAQWLTTDLLLADVALLVGLYSVAAHERRRWGVAAAVIVMEVGALLVALDADGDGRLLSFLSISAFVVAAAVLGVYVRTRGEHIAALELRAAQLERERDQQAQLAAAAERARIARELHDVVAHNLTVMIALADGARLTAGSDPAAADAAIGNVSATGREALGEMRRLLGVLRADDAGGADAADAGAAGAGGAAPLQPQPGLDQLDALVAQVRGAGLQTRLVRSGAPAPLSPGAQLTVYRLVQEALTNTLKHARSPSSAEVRLEWGEDALALEVVDDGIGSPPVAVAGERGAPATAAEGHGLAGMRERAAAYGAVIEAGPRPRGGWSVRTRLRLDGEAAPR
ncbi:histidine kinase [Conexibacter stalactiti]|uniref:histidine kinase n=1 Tax=Conexibacter stalactiti TaxID=1940611 RepID=A0ABU4HUJ5_9ACTN|nr:histidine kinase [Conexibacter stalactiti]MDW5596988.1 histidine kinase [Conexibacter stalactiti]MEC5037630.1 histidine kinase [Conexibacter stalactiti]